MKPAVVVVGSLNMDFVVRTKHLPAAGETVLGDGFRMIPGGKGANQAVAAGKLGAASVRVKMIGRVGMDLFGDHLKASLSGAGVDVTAVSASRGLPTGVALISVDAAGQNQIVVASGANMDLPAGEAEAMRRVFKGGSVALFQLETPLDTVAAALRIARAGGSANHPRSRARPAPARRPASPCRHHHSERGRSPDAGRQTARACFPRKRRRAGRRSGDSRRPHGGAQTGRQRLLVVWRGGIPPHPAVPRGSHRHHSRRRHLQRGLGHRPCRCVRREKARLLA